MRKIFTLCAASLVCAGAFAQSAEYGIYTDLSKNAKIRGFKNADEDYVFGVKDDGVCKVALAEGETVKAYAKLKEENNADKEQDFNSGRIYLNGVQMTVSHDVLLYVSGFRDGTTKDNCTISSDNDATSRFPEDEDFINKDNGDGTFDTGYWYGKETTLQPMSTKTDMAEQNPGYWVGASIEVPAGKQLNVEKISAVVAAGNAFWWCIDVISEAGDSLYKSGTCCMQFSNGDKNTQYYWIGGSADITADAITEPNGGSIYGHGTEVLGSEYANFDLLTLPIDSAKAAAFEAAQGAQFGAGKTPLYNFKKLPANLNLPAGKNTVRIYFGKRNSRLFCPVQLLLTATLADASSIENVAANRNEKACYNLAGQRMQSRKGLCIMGNKVTLCK